MLDKFIPKNFFYFLDLIRFNKPIGFLLLMWPCWFGLAYSNKSYNDLFYFSALICLIGHIFPVWLKFKGGKGVATYLGIIFALSFKFGIIFGITWLLVSFIFRYSSLASMIAALIIFSYSIILDNTSLCIFLFISFIIILYTHRENIVRLKDSKETKIKL